MPAAPIQPGTHGEAAGQPDGEQQPAGPHHRSARTSGTVQLADRLGRSKET